MKRTGTAAAVLIPFLGYAPGTNAGSYSRILDCNDGTGQGEDGGCVAALLVTQVVPCAPNCTTNPFGITHPMGYDGTGEALQFRICVANVGNSRDLVEPTKRAIATWNALSPTMTNCSASESLNPIGCRVWEDGTPPDGTLHAESIILHELGHCPMGLDHVNKNWDTDDPPDGVFQETSFTRSGDAQRPSPPLPGGGISAGDDGIPGSYDDFHEAEAGNDTPADNVGWYRTSDNDPVIVDNTTINRFSYTRKINAAGEDLPPGHTWSANANREVTRNPPLSTPPAGRPPFDTTAVMYSLIAAEQEFHALSADEVNMVKMGMTGVNREIGGGDDYTIELIYVDDCANQHDVMILYDNLPLGVGGQCLNALIDYSYTQNPGTAQHFSQTTADPGVEPLFIQLNQNENYSLDPPNAIFVDGFESNTYPWSSVVQ